MTNAQTPLINEARKIAHDYKHTMTFGADNNVNRRAQARRITRLETITRLLGYDPTA